MITSTPIRSLKSFLILLVKPYKKWILLIAFSGLFWGIINTFLPFFLKLVIDQVTEFKGPKAEIISITLPYAFGYLGLWVALCLNMRGLDWVKLKLFPNLRQDIMNTMFQYLNLHSTRYFQNNFAGSLINKITDMQSSVINILNNLDDLYAQTIGLTIATLTLLYVHPIFALTLVLWASFFLLITIFYLKPIQQLSHVFAESRTTVVGRMVDSISNITNVRLFSRQREENVYIDNSIALAVNNDRAMQRKIITMRIFWDVSAIILMGFNLLTLLSLYSRDLVTIGDFTFVMSLSISVLWNLWFLASQFVSFSEQVGVCQQALTSLSLAHEIVDSKNAPPLAISKGTIQFKGVSFHYDAGKKLFQNKNILIPGGQKVGLVGYTGSGKSTFVNLILRLFEVETGEINIDGQNIRHVQQDSLREQIALIPQDVALFHRSLMDNIRFGNPHATDEMVVAAAKQAHCHEFIFELPQGYNTLVGERGVKLSGGQRQRIAIARAILKNAPILILDEATSALDSITERAIQDTLDSLMQNKTTLVIAHRLSTLSKMDRILVFHEGKIIEDGSHNELLANNQHYAKMWRMQAGGFLPDTE